VPVVKLTFSVSVRPATKATALAWAAAQEELSSSSVVLLVTGRAQGEGKPRKGVSVAAVAEGKS
jgi:hypothetical protein